VNLSDYGALQYTQLIVGLVSAPSTMYLALTYSEPTPSGLGTDLDEPVDATGYARKSIASSDWQLVASDIATVVNTPTYTWTPAVDWEVVMFAVLCTSVGTNQVWAWSELDPVQPLANYPYVISPGALILAVSGPSDQMDV
jgi:hypothetical protein